MTASNMLVTDNLDVKGNITAQQYIVSSSVYYSTQSYSSGSTLFGDTVDDTHGFTGSVGIYLTGSGPALYVTGSSLLVDNAITASGNISTSLDIEARNITASGEISASKFMYASGVRSDVDLFTISNEKTTGNLSIGTGAPINEDPIYITSSVSNASGQGRGKVGMGGMTHPGSTLQLGKGSTYAQGVSNAFAVLNASDPTPARWWPLGWYEAKSTTQGYIRVHGTLAEYTSIESGSALVDVKFQSGSMGNSVLALGSTYGVIYT